MEHQISRASVKYWSKEDFRALPIGVIAASLIGLVTFAYFASTVAHFPGEVQVSTWVQSWRSSWMDTLMIAFTALGDLAVAGPLVLLTSIVMYRRGWRSEGILIFAAAVAGRFVNLGLKELVARPRPSDDFVQVLQDIDTYTFPSGHVMHYMVFFGTLVFVLTMTMRPGVTVRLIQGALLLCLIGVGISRIYMGAHWLGDVVAGYSFGAAVVAGAAMLWWRWSANPASKTKGHQV